MGRTLEVILNGTDTNPFSVYGLTQNPFSQWANASYDHWIMQLQQLGADPIKSEEDIRDKLRVWSSEFIELCVGKFVLGRIVKFTIELPESLGH